MCQLKTLWWESCPDQLKENAPRLQNIHIKIPGRIRSDKSNDVYKFFLHSKIILN